MKTQLPEPALHLPEGKYTFQCEAQHIHREPFYTEAQLRAAMVAAWNDAIEDAAKVCDELAGMPNAMYLAESIRKLKEQA